MRVECEGGTRDQNRLAVGGGLPRDRDEPGDVKLPLAQYERAARGAHRPHQVVDHEGE